MFDHVFIALLTLYDINYFTWSACEGSQNILRVSHISLLFPWRCKQAWTLPLGVCTVTCYLRVLDFWGIFLQNFSSNCLGYRGQASICTYESTSEREFRIVIMDNFPPPDPTWHEGFCFSLLAPLLWIFPLLRGSDAQLDAVTVIESCCKRRL